MRLSITKHQNSKRELRQKWRAYRHIISRIDELHRKRSLHFLVICILSMLINPGLERRHQAFATTLQPLSLGQLTRLSTLVIHGVVTTRVFTKFV